MALNNILRAPVLRNDNQGGEQQPEQPAQQNLRTITIDPIKYSHKLPNFDGSTEGLKTFIDAVDTLIPILRQYDVPSQRLVANIIKTKIIGKAQTILNINCNVSTWTEIREILISNFSDKKNSYQLLDDLKSSTFNNTVLEFYNTIQERLQRLNIKSELEQRNLDTDSTKRIALDVFKHKMIEPVRSVLFSRNPRTLEEALQILTEGNYLEYRNRKLDLKNQNHNLKRNHKPFHPSQQNNFQRHYNPQSQNNPQYQNNKFRPRSQQFQHNSRNTNSNDNNNLNSVQSRIRRFGQPQPMDVDNSQQFVQTNTNFPIIASENNANSLISE